MTVKEHSINGIVFKVGGTYTHRLGTYTVVRIIPKEGKILALFGQEHRAINIEIASRMAQNMQAEQSKQLGGIRRHDSQQDFAWTLGAFAAVGLVSGETGYYSWHKFVARYTHATRTNERDIRFAYRCDPKTNKPGCELRVCIPTTLTEAARFALPESVDFVTDKHGNTTINRNAFWWHLVEKLGFRLGNTQDADEIESRLPESMREHFRQGYNDNRP